MQTENITQSVSGDVCRLLWPLEQDLPESEEEVASQPLFRPEVYWDGPPESSEPDWLPGWLALLPDWQLALARLWQTETLGKHLGILSDALPLMSWDITLISNQAIQALNRQHRDKDQPTDVLSFPLWDLEHWPPQGLPEIPLGSIVVSVDYGLAMTETRIETYLLERMTHGTLHLLGWHHDTEEDYARVVAWQQQVLADVQAASLLPMPN